MATFSLIDEPWIPCIAPDGLVLLGLRQTLLGADEIEQLADPSPLVTLALHRLLLAILHHVFGPENDDEWGKLWSVGAWDRFALEQYFEGRRHRFDLFSDQHPFYQASDLTVGDADVSAYKLVLELSPSNSRLFSHTDDANPPVLSPAEAARALVANQSFHPGGLVRKRCGAGPTSGRAGPLAGAAVCLLTGKSLFETLALNMVSYCPGRNRPFPTTDHDCPAWDRGEPPNDEQRRPRGYLEWLTWQSRCIRLAPDEEGGELSVRRAVIARGTGLPGGESEQPFEQMVGFRARKDAKPAEEPYSPVSLRRERVVWRDSDALFQSAGGGERPRTLSAVSDRVEQGYLNERATHPLAMYGVAYDQANALFWREERLPLPLAYLDDQMLFGKLTTALGLVEAAASALRSATGLLAAYLLNIKPDSKLTRDRREALNRRRAAMGAERRYWAQLAPHFSRFLVDQARRGDVALQVWGTEVLNVARRVYEEVAEGLGADGGALHVEVDGRGQLERMLARASKNHPFGGPPREEAS